MNLSQYSMKSTKLIVSLIITLMTTASISAPALAGDRKIYSGNTCKSEDGDIGLNFGSNATTSSGAANRKIICPVVREKATAAAGALKASINTDTQSVTCSFTVAQPNGLAIFVNPTAAPVAIGGGVWRTDILAIPQVADGAYYITCTLPTAGDAVLRYEVSE